MDEQTLPEDFKEFLKLLNEHKVEYLLIGGYAVGYHGYPRTTADIDIWVALNSTNASKLVDVFHQFGMRDPNVTQALFLEAGKIIRMGTPPMRIEVLTEIDGVVFDVCYQGRETPIIDGEVINVISLRHLRENKIASGRYKDLDDLNHLPESL